MNIVTNTPAKEVSGVLAKYFHFSQNNSGGSFIINDSVAHHVIIQAYSSAQANQIATDVGLYFDGCSTGEDCDCCGDRWSEFWGDDGDDTPLIYGEDPKAIEDMFTKPGQPVCHVYYLDGSKTTYTKPMKGL